MAARKTSIIPMAPFTRILIRHGAQRVSAEASKEFAGIITEIAAEIAEQATKIATHSGRKTILENDIRLAAKQ